MPTESAQLTKSETSLDNEATAAEPAVQDPQPRRRESRMFASFKVLNYRFFFAGALVSNIGTWMQRIGQDWLVLTHLTDHSSTALGIVTALQFLAIPLLAPLAGAVVDRLPKRQLLMVTQMLLGISAGLLWLMVALDVVQLWHVYVFALLQGVLASFDNPARQSFVSEIVDAELLPNAVGLNSTSFNGARMCGPALAGVLVAAVGVAPTLLINALSFGAMIAALALMRPELLHPAPPAKGHGAVRDGLRYVARRPDIIVLLVIVFMLGTFGMNFQIWNATMATTVFGRGAAEFGLLGTIMAVGTLGGALMAARRVRPRIRTILVALAGFSICSLLLAAAPSYEFYAVMLVPAGFTALTVMTSANASVQLATAPSYRGRVMALYMAIFFGGTPLGAPIIGWIGGALGPRASVLMGALLTGLCVAGVLIWMMVHEGLRLKLQRRWPVLLTRWTEVEVESREAAAER